MCGDQTVVCICYIGMMMRAPLRKMMDGPEPHGFEFVLAKVVSQTVFPNRTEPQLVQHASHNGSRPVCM
jgi:hypothetical protein